MQWLPSTSDFSHLFCSSSFYTFSLQRLLFGLWTITIDSHLILSDNPEQNVELSRPADKDLFKFNRFLNYVLFVKWSEFGQEICHKTVHIHIRCHFMNCHNVSNILNGSLTILIYKVTHVYHHFWYSQKVILISLHLLVNLCHSKSMGIIQNTRFIAIMFPQSYKSFHIHFY